MNKKVKSLIIELIYELGGGALIWYYSNWQTALGVILIATACNVASTRKFGG